MEVLSLCIESKLIEKQHLGRHKYGNNIILAFICRVTLRYFAPSNFCDFSIKYFKKKNRKLFDTKDEQNLESNRLTKSDRSIQLISGQ